MAEIHKIATYNINGMSAGDKMTMLNEFLYKQEIDIMLLQEVTHTDFDSVRGYSPFQHRHLKERYSDCN